MLKVLTVAWREFKQTVFRPIFIIAVLGMPVLIIGIMAVAGIMTVTHKEPPLTGTVAILEASGEVAAAAETEFSEEAIRKDERRQAEADAARVAETGITPAMPAGATPGAMPMQRGEVHVDVNAVTEFDAAVIDNFKQRVRDGDLLAAAVVQPRLLEIPPPPGEGMNDETDSEQPEAVDGSTPDEEAEMNPQADAPDEPAPTPGLQLFVGETIDSDHVRLIERRVGQAVVRVRVERAGLDPDQAFRMLKRPSVDTKRALAEGGETKEAEGQRVARMMIPMVFMMLIWIGAFTSGQHLMMSTIEEKSNRVMEVLLSAVSPMQLMTGKIFGHGGVGLLIVGIYSSVGVAALIALALFNQFISIMDLVYLAVFYFMAYFMVASMMAAVGSAVSDIREANTLVTPVMMILMVPLMLWMPISQAPNGMIATIFSFIPPAIPFAMILRMAAEEPVPMWQMAASIVWGYICVFGMVWGAAKIFRIGVLMYGKPPSPVELIKWLRYS